VERLRPGEQQFVVSPSPLYSERGTGAPRHGVPGRGAGRPPGVGSAVPVRPPARGRRGAVAADRRPAATAGPPPGDQRRAGKLQARPFAKGQPAAQPKKPGPGITRGRRSPARRPTATPSERPGRPCPRR
jgi:hypothetical protein